MNNQPFGEDPADQSPSSPPPSPAPDVENDSQPDVADQQSPTADGIHTSKQQLRNTPDSSEEFIANAYASEPAPSPYEQVSQQPQPDGKSKKGLIIGVAAGALLLLGGGAAAAYNYWYQNPQKVITDAVVNMFKAKSVIADGSFVIDYKGESSSDVGKLSISIEARADTSTSAADAKLAVEAGGNKYEFSGSALYDSEANVYFKINDVQKTLDSFLDAENVDSSEVPPSVNKIVEKVDGKWIRISADDLKEYSEDTSKQQECIADVYKKYESNKELQQQLGDAYRNNQFITIKEHLGSRDGALGYVIGGDEEKAQSFVKAVQETEVYKDIKDCDDSFDFDADDITTEDADEDAEVRFELWVTRFGHQLKQVKVTAEDDDASGEFTINTRFNEDVAVDAPTDFISLKDLIADIEEITTEMYGGFDSSPESTYEYEFEWDETIELDTTTDFSIEES